MFDLNPVQKRTVWAIHGHCAEIASLANGGGEETGEVVAIQADAEAIDRHCEELGRELAFAVTVCVPSACLNRIRDDVLPKDYHDRFKPSTTQAA